MHFTRRVLLLAALGSAALTGARAAGNDKPAKEVAKVQYREIKWEALVPKNWDPTKRFRDQKLSMLDDSDPRQQEMLAEMRATWDNAPTSPDMDQVDVKIPGYVVPLDEVDGGLKEFLLVPYFGACIHTPPPPANQIVHVLSSKPVKGFRAMDTVWVSGRLRAFRADSSMGTSGYRLDAALVDRYEAPPRRLRFDRGQ